MIIIFFIMLNLIQMDCRLSEMVVMKTILDFEHFYQGLISVTESFDIEYDLEYIMQDACDAPVKHLLKVEFACTSSLFQIFTI
jgi:hypothetical protein